MQLIQTSHDPSFIEATSPTLIKRDTARGIIFKGDKCLMIYTKRYNDYSFPGGGVAEDEDIQEGLIRELQEETGAQNIQITSALGRYESIVPYRGNNDFLQETAFYFLCTADDELGQANPESYEIKNGSVPVWVNCHTALAHNQTVIKASPPSMGNSIIRETYVLSYLIKHHMPPGL